MSKQINKNYELIIIGGGPAGIMAGVYALRSGIKTLLIEKESYGGQVSTSFEIKNFLGFDEISGPELAEKMRQQYANLNGESLFDEVLSFNKEEDDSKTIVTAYSGIYNAPTIIFAPGAYPRKLGIEKEEYFNGKGIGYCAICDGGFYKDKVVAVVGGGNTAFEDAIYLSNVAKKVYIISRRDKYRAIDALVKNAKKISERTKKIEFIVNSNVSKLIGEDYLKSVEITNSLDQKKQILKVDGLFIAVGRIPATTLLKDIVDMDNEGYIKANSNLETNIKGLYVAGDARVKEIRQIITAASDGAIAATYANNYLNERRS